MSYSWWTSQILQSIAIVLFIVGFQFERRRMLAIFATSAVLTSAHYLCLWMLAGAAIAAVVAVRILVAIHYPGWLTGAVFTAISVAASFATWQGLASIYAGAGGFLGTIASFMEEGQPQRAVFILASVPWTIYAIISHSPMAIVSELLILSSAVIGMWRFGSQTAKIVSV